MNKFTLYRWEDFEKYVQSCQFLMVNYWIYRYIYIKQKKTVNTKNMLRPIQSKLSYGYFDDYSNVFAGASIRPALRTYI